MKKIVGLLLVLVLFSCNKKANVPMTFDYGSIENGIYDNTFFKFKLPINQEWYVLDNKEANEVYKIGNEVASGEDEFLKKKMTASQINVAKLVTTFRVAPGTNITFNPSLIINAENLNNSPQIKSVNDYLSVAKQLLGKTAMNIEYLEEKDLVKIGSQDFGFLKLENKFNETSILQDYYVTLKKGFAISFIMSYTNEDEKEMLYEMFNELKI